MTAGVVPIVMLVGGYALMAYLNEVANPSSLLFITGNLALVMVFGLIVYLPAVAVTLVGAAALTSRPRAGRVVITVGLAWMSALWVLVGVEQVVSSLRPPPTYDDYSWSADLSFPESLGFAIPFAAMTLVNVYSARVVWTARTPVVPG